MTRPASYQPGILEPIPDLGRYLLFELKPGQSPAASLDALVPMVDGQTVVMGLGLALVQQLGGEIPGLRSFPLLVNAGLEIPSTPRALCLWLRGRDRGQLALTSRRLVDTLRSAFELVQCEDAFKYDAGLDLSGYEDGTENPQGDDALAAAFLASGDARLDGSSFMALQQWQHDMGCLEQYDETERDNMIGRRHCDNEELDDAPESSHVKRTAQESFEPEAFVLRRSMPWADAERMGLMFVAFGKSFDAFEAQLNRMAGFDDGITDALFKFTRPVTGSYFWCPPMRDGEVDLTPARG